MHGMVELLSRSIVAGFPGTGVFCRGSIAPREGRQLARLAHISWRAPSLRIVPLAFSTAMLPQEALPLAQQQWGQDPWLHSQSDLQMASMHIAQAHILDKSFSCA